MSIQIAISPTTIKIEISNKVTCKIVNKLYKMEEFPLLEMNILSNFFKTQKATLSSQMHFGRFVFLTNLETLAEDKEERKVAANVQKHSVTKTKPNMFEKKIKIFLHTKVSMCSRKYKAREHYIETSS